MIMTKEKKTKCNFFLFLPIISRSYERKIFVSRTLPQTQWTNLSFEFSKPTWETMSYNFPSQFSPRFPQEPRCKCAHIALLTSQIRKEKSSRSLLADGLFRRELLYRYCNERRRTDRWSNKKQQRVEEARDLIWFAIPSGFPDITHSYHRR